METVLEINNNNVVKALWIIWNPSSDIFFFLYTGGFKHNKTTKKTATSNIRQFCDPLVQNKRLMVSAKAFLQQLWKLHIDLDESQDQTQSPFWGF